MQVKKCDFSKLRNNEQFQFSTEFKAFIAELNALIDNYRNLLAQRQGRAEAKKEKEESK